MSDNGAEKPEFQAILERQAKEVQSMQSGLSIALKGGDELGSDYLIKEAISSDLFQPVVWSWKIYSEEEARSFYREGNPEPLIAIRVKEDTKVRNPEPVQYLNWSRTVRSQKGVDIPSFVGEYTKREYSAVSLHDVLVARSRTETFPGGDAKMRTMLWIAFKIDRDSYKPDRFLNLIKYYCSVERIGKENVSGMSPSVITPKGGDTLWMTRLITLFNGWYLARSTVFKYYELAMREAVEWIAVDPYVRAAKLKKILAPFTMCVGFEASGETTDWLGNSPETVLRSPGSFDRAASACWKVARAEALDQLHEAGFTRTPGGLIDMMEHAHDRQYTKQFGYEMSLMKYISNIAGYGRITMAIAVEQTLSAGDKTLPDKFPAWQDVFDTGIETMSKALSPSGEVEASPMMDLSYHKRSIINAMTSNSAGGRFFTSMSVVKGKRIEMRNATKIGNFMYNPKSVDPDIRVTEMLPPPDRYKTTWEWIEALLAWVRRRPLGGKDSDLLTKKRPGFVATRAVPGVKPERLVLMIPVEVMAFEGIINMLLMRFGLNETYYTVSSQSGRVFEDHLESAKTGCSEYDVLQKYVNVSTDFSSYDVTQLLQHDVVLLAGMAKSIWDSGMWYRKVGKWTIPERLFIMKALFYKSCFSIQGGSASKEGFIERTDFLLEDLDMRLSGEFGTMTRNSALHKGVATWVYKNLTSLDMAKISDRITELFKINTSSDEVSSCLKAWQNRDFSIRQYMGDDGKLCIPVGSQEPFAPLDYAALAVGLEVAMAMNGWLMHALKFNIGCSLIEYLKVFFCRGAVHPNYMQLLPQREKDSKLTNVVDQIKSIADYAAMACVRGGNPEFLNRFYMGIIAVKWSVRDAGEFRNLNAIDLFTGDGGPGIYPGKVWLGSLNLLIDYYRQGDSFDRVTLDDVRRDLIRGVKAMLSQGKVYVTQNLDRSRVRSSGSAVSTLLENGIDIGELAYTRLGDRFATRAAAAGKVEQKSWKMSKMNVSPSIVRKLPFKISYGATVSQVHKHADVPIGGVQGDVLEILTYLGVRPGPVSKGQGLIKFLRRLDAGFPGDISDSELARVILSVSEEHIPTVLEAMGATGAALTVDMKTMVEQMIPDELSQGVMGAYYPYIDLSNENLERISFCAKAEGYPILKRWSQLIGVAFFVIQKPPFRQIIIDVDLEAIYGRPFF